MGWLWINPDHAEEMARLRLCAAGDFLKLSGIIVGGHLDRHVMRLELPRPLQAPLVCYLKKDHAVRWADRLLSFWVGCGWASRSVREARVLQLARQAGLGCPQVLACGEENGQAFLLVGNLDMAELRHFLQAYPWQRRRLSQTLGRELARMHASGFQHPEVYAKHVLVRKSGADYQLAFLDWQLARRRGSVGLKQRCRDLAALHATLADELAAPGERFACLHAYHQAFSQRCPGQSRATLNQMVDLIESDARRLLRKRRIREMRQPALPTLAQNLIWLDGEALCVTLDFWKETAGTAPPWLNIPVSAPLVWPHWEETRIVHAGRDLSLTRRWFQPSARWWPGRRNGFGSPEFQQASTLFRLQRFGVHGPRLLAVGQRDVPGGKYSFLLLEPDAEARPWQGLEDEAPFRQAFCRVLGRFLRRIHDAGYGLTGGPCHPRPHWGLVPSETDDVGELVLLRLDGLARTHTPEAQRLGHDLAMIAADVGQPWFEDDVLHLVQGVLEEPATTAAARNLMHALRSFIAIKERQVA